MAAQKTTKTTAAANGEPALATIPIAPDTRSKNKAYGAAKDTLHKTDI